MSHDRRAFPQRVTDRLPLTRAVVRANTFPVPTTSAAVIQLLLTLLGVVTLSGLAHAGVANARMPEDVDVAAGAQLYAEHCANCHGADLEGAENWQVAGADGRFPAPPHDETGHTWHHSDRMLFEYTKLGGRALMAAQGMEFDSGMPGFGDRLSDREIWSILGFIKSTWPERARQIQAAQTEADLSSSND